VRYCQGNRNQQRSDFKPVGGMKDLDAWRLHGDRGADNRAHRTNMRIRGRTGQVHTKVELRSKEQNSEEQREKWEAMRLARHLLDKT